LKKGVGLNTRNSGRSPNPLQEVFISNTCRKIYPSDGYSRPNPLIRVYIVVYYLSIYLFKEKEKKGKKEKEIFSSLTLYIKIIPLPKNPVKSFFMLTPIFFDVIICVWYGQKREEKERNN
jgi:hypothetical protein